MNLGAFQGLNFEPEKYLRAILSRGNNFFHSASASREQSRLQANHSLRTNRLSKFRASLRARQESRRAATGRERLDRHRRAHGRNRRIAVAMDEQAYRAGVEREVNEEIKIDTPFEDRIVALLNDDTTKLDVCILASFTFSNWQNRRWKNAKR